MTRLAAVINPIAPKTFTANSSHAPAPLVRVGKTGIIGIYTLPFAPRCQTRAGDGSEADRDGNEGKDNHDDHFRILFCESFTAPATIGEHLPDRHKARHKHPGMRLLFEKFDRAHGVLAG